MEVLSYAAQKLDNRVKFNCSDGREFITNKWVDAITYLLEVPCIYVVVPHIDKFTDAIMSLLPSKAVSDLQKTDRAVLANGEKLFYSAGRKLSIGYGYRGNERNEVDIYGLSRYTEKEITNPQELLVLWQEVVNAYNEFGLVPDNLSSPVAVYEKKLDGIKFARTFDLPQSADSLIDKLHDESLAWEEWRATYKLGYWKADECTDLDISSAYASHIAKLPDLTGAKFYELDTMPDKCSFGLMDGKLHIDKDVTPFYYTGTFSKTITTGLLQRIKKYNWGTFEMKHGWFVDVPKGYRTPFSDIMNEFYHIKSTTDKPIVKRAAKDISNGIGGKFNSIYSNKPGRNYQPIYAKMITSACECQVSDTIWENGLMDKVISVTVDGILIDGTMRLEHGNGMGSWRVEPSSDCLVLSQLYQWLNEKHPNGSYVQDMIKIFNDRPNDRIYGDIDFNLITYDRDFTQLPKTGGDLLTKRYNSLPIEKH